MKSADGARRRREGLAPNTLSLPFQTPATQAKRPICRYQFLNVGGWEGNRGIGAAIEFFGQIPDPWDWKIVEM